MKNSPSHRSNDSAWWSDWRPHAVAAAAIFSVAVAPTYAANVPPKGGVGGAACTLQNLQSFTLPTIGTGTQILATTYHAAGGGLPAYCTVVGVIDKRVSRDDPDHFTYGIGFAVNLPDSWVGRFEMMGGGGTDGSLNQNPVGNGTVELASGWAVAADDGGHEDQVAAPLTWQDDDPKTGGAGHFGLDDRSLVQYGSTHIDMTTRTVKAILANYYGVLPGYSYFWGCSNGGRDAMLQSQRYPDNFDGILAGNPAFNLTRSGADQAWNSQAIADISDVPKRTDTNGDPFLPDAFSVDDQTLLGAAIEKACDGLDGLVDGIIENYSACTNARVYPQLAALTCTGAKTAACLTPSQVAAVKKIWRGASSPLLGRIYSPWYWDAGIFNNGWGSWIVGTPSSANPPTNNSRDLTLFAEAVAMVFLNPPEVTPVNGLPAGANPPQSQEDFLLRYNFNTDFPRSFARTRAHPLSPHDNLDAVSLDMRPFERRGGKIIFYHAGNDGVFSSLDFVNWYNAMNEFMLRRADSFSRLYIVPNMAHCRGGSGPLPAFPTFLNALTQWVESGAAPTSLVGEVPSANPYAANPSLFAPGAAANYPAGGQRPVCPYPQQNRYVGGPPTAASSYTCVYVPPVKTLTYFDLEDRLPGGLGRRPQSEGNFDRDGDSMDR